MSAMWPATSRAKQASSAWPSTSKVVYTDLPSRPVITIRQSKSHAAAHFSGLCRVRRRVRRRVQCRGRWRGAAHDLLLKMWPSATPSATGQDRLGALITACSGTKYCLPEKHTMYLERAAAMVLMGDSSIVSWSSVVDICTARAARVSASQSRMCARWAGGCACADTDLLLLRGQGVHAQVRAGPSGTNCEAGLAY